MFRRIHKFTEALNQFSRVQKRLPNDKTVYFERGLVFQDMGNHQNAIADFSQAIKLDSEY